MRAARCNGCEQRTLKCDVAGSRIVFLNELLKQPRIDRAENYSVAFPDMTTSPLFPGFDGLMTLSRREGVDIRPTLLRVLTDLYVQANAHSAEEERQFAELTSRLIDQVDDATRAAVRARLAIYPGTPVEVSRKLGLKPASPNQRVPLAPEIPASSSATSPVKPPSEARSRMASHLSMQPTDAAEISEMFFHASAGERALILHNLQQTPLRASARIPAARAARAIET